MEPSTLPLSKRIAGLVILTFLNAVTNSDRFGVAGVLPELSSYYNIANTEAGLIQSLFLAAAVVGAPVMGYFGDRYPRKKLLLLGIAVWIVIMIASSFVPENMFWFFLFLRCLDGFSENIVFACGPSLIADYFQEKARCYAFMFFYYSLAIGAGGGVMISSVIGSYAPWQWALRFSPFLAFIGWLCVLFFLEEPTRRCEHKDEKYAGKKTSFWQDVQYLSGIKTYVCACLGRAFVGHFAGSQGWWSPTVIQNAMNYQKNSSLELYEKVWHGQDFPMVMVSSNLITITAALLGTSFVVHWAASWKAGKGVFRNMKTLRAPALVIAISLTISAPATYCIYLTTLWSVYALYFAQFTSISLTGSAFVLSTEIAYDVTKANRRATSVMVMSFMEHLLGDGPGPYIVGMVADRLKGADTSYYAELWSLIHAFFFTSACVVPATLCFYCAVFFMKDEAEAQLLEEAGSARSRRASNEAMQPATKA